MQLATAPFSIVAHSVIPLELLIDLRFSYFW